LCNHCGGSNVGFIAAQIIASRQLENRTLYDQAIE